MATVSDASPPYAGRSAVLATMHRKEEAIAPVFLSTLGLRISPSVGLDTDQLGTFSGDVPRVGTMLDVAVRKARLGMTAMKMSLGLASEGSFGPHPSLPFLHAGMELLAFVDDERGFVVHESLVADSTNFDHAVVLPGDGLEGFLARVGFPDHGLPVRPNQGPCQLSCAKGVVDRDRLVRTITQAATESTDGRARLETDMRAHFNPTRMKSLGALANRLAQRLRSRCPACGAPGFGRTEGRIGLPCAACDMSTELVTTELFVCPCCGHARERPRADGLQRAPAQHCAQCNP